MNKQAHLVTSLLLSLLVFPINRSVALAAPTAKANNSETQRLMKSAEAAFRQKRWSQVVAFTTRVIGSTTLQKTVPGAAFSLRAQSYEALGKRKEAIADYRRVAANTREGRQAFDSLTRLLSLAASAISPSATTSDEPVPETAAPEAVTPKPGAKQSNSGISSSSILPRPAQPPKPGDPVVAAIPVPFPEPPLSADLPAPALASWNAATAMSGWAASASLVTSLVPLGSNPITALAIAPHGNIVALGSWQGDRNKGATTGSISLWGLKGNSGSTRTLQPIAQQNSRWSRPWNGKGPIPAFFGHFGRLSALAFSPGGAMLASAGVGGGITIWSGSDGKPLRVLRDEKLLSQNPVKAPPIIALTWKATDTGLGLWALDADGTLFGWNLAHGDNQFRALAPRTLQAPALGATGWAVEAAFSHDASHLAIGDAKGNIGIYAPETGARFATFNNSLTQEIRNDGTNVDGIAVSALAFSPSGNLLASANFSHVYLNKVPVSKSDDASDSTVDGKPISTDASAETDAPFPAAFQNRLARLNQRVDVLLWSDEESLVARSTTALTALVPQLLLKPHAELDAASAAVLNSPRVSADRQSAVAALSPTEELYMEAIPVGDGIEIRILVNDVAVAPPATPQ